MCLLLTSQEIRRGTVRTCPKRLADIFRGVKFRAGLQVANTGEEINFDSEREIFHFLGLRYVPPELRNADG